MGAVSPRTADTCSGACARVLPAGRRALASVIPPLERMKDWALSYSTQRHGISLQTLYRKAVASQPAILLVRDFGGT
jgi:hypothetical protein